MRRINLKLPDELYEKLRAHCRAQGQTVQGALTVLIRLAVAEVVVPEMKRERSAEARALASWRRVI